MSGRVIAQGQRNFVPVLAAGVLLLLSARVGAEAPQVPFTAGFNGTFTLAFGAGPGGTDDLQFSGTGRSSHLGRSAVDGRSFLIPDPDEPGCSIIDPELDRVVLTAANGDELWLANSGEDCLDFSVPGRVFIRGSGTFAVVGGTGRFVGATGAGTFSVVAEVLAFEDGGVSGTFELGFDGTISPPGH